MGRRDKSCFVISPIGKVDSELRNYADVVFEFIIRPVAERHSYLPVRVDHIHKPGLITPDIINRLLVDELVIADLTMANPNVTYELAIRHMMRMPVISIRHSYGELPFDIQGMRTIPFVYGNAKSMVSCRDDISKYIEFIEANPSKVDSPITQSINLQAIQQSDEPNKDFMLQLQSQIQSVSAKLDDMKTSQTFHPRIVQAGEAPPFPGQNVTFDPARIWLDRNESLGSVVIGPSLGNIKPTVIPGPNVIGEPSLWNVDSKKKSEKKEDK